MADKDRHTKGLIPSKAGHRHCAQTRKIPASDDTTSHDPDQDEPTSDPEHLIVEMSARTGIERLEAWQRMRGALFQDAGALSREWTWEAIDVVRSIMLKPVAKDRDRLEAAKLLLDRGHGRPVETVQTQVEQMSDEELRRHLQEAAKTVLGLEPDADS